MDAITQEDFFKQVKTALEHLYDFSYLEQHPFTAMPRLNIRGAVETGGQRFRKDLIRAIEMLNPQPDSSFNSPHSRVHDVIHLHYVEGLTILETAYELGMSERQAYRDLRRGEESVTSILRSWYLEEISAQEETTFTAEIEQFPTKLQPLDVQKLIAKAHSAIEPLAHQQGVMLALDLPHEPVVISSDPLIAQQVLVNILSHTIQRAQPDFIHIQLVGTGSETSLSIRYSPRPGAAQGDGVKAVVLELMRRLDWHLNLESLPNGESFITLKLHSSNPTVLVIDDYEGLIDLVKRYLSGYSCRVLSSTDGEVGLRLAQEIIPSVIILDVMIPGMDGWEILQRLRNQKRLADIPIIICSVFNDPELAYSLGASAFLSKPLNRGDVLNMLRKLNVL